MEDDDFEQHWQSLFLSKAQLGSAGEFLTAGKLLLMGFNVYTSAIDDGIDLVASKNNEFYKIQVKTCQDLEGYDSGKYMIGVNLSTLSAHEPAKTFIVIVIHYLNGQISVDNAGSHDRYDQRFAVVPAEVLFDFVGRQEGKVTIRVHSSLLGVKEEPWMFKLRYDKRDLVLDEYVWKSFSRIGVEPGS